MILLQAALAGRMALLMGGIWSFYGMLVRTITLPIVRICMPPQDCTRALGLIYTTN
jgi:hypothetical protein